MYYVLLLWCAVFNPLAQALIYVILHVFTYKTWAMVCLKLLTKYSSTTFYCFCLPYLFRLSFRLLQWDSLFLINRPHHNFDYTSNLSGITLTWLAAHWNNSLIRHSPLTESIPESLSTFAPVQTCHFLFHKCVCSCAYVIDKLNLYFLN